MADPGPAAAPGRPDARADPLSRGPGRTEVDTGLSRAELIPEPGRPWRVLLRLDGEDCSHVDLRDPTHLEFAYVRRLADLADLVAPPRAPIAALHLGGGAFTLPRYVARTRPGSRQVAVEVDPGLVDLARDQLELRTGPELKVRIADAGLVLARRSPASTDLLVLDAFAGPHVPAHLITPEALAQAGRALKPAGLFGINVIDDTGLPIARELAALLRRAFPHTAVVAARKVLRGRVGGNVVLVAGHAPLPADELARRALRGAAPELVLSGADAERF